MFYQFKNTFWLVITIGIFTINTNAQLGSCGGNSGDPIFKEDFGRAPSAATQHVPLPSSQTNYIFVGTNPSQNDFFDGRYSVTNFNYQQYDWFNEPDHTPGDSNGRMLVVNASFTPGQFYKTTITGLCENTTYEFSAWLKNLTPRNSRANPPPIRPCNVKFEIWNSTDTVLLKSGSTGDFFGSLISENGVWIESALVFQTQVGQNSVILKMVNNGVGGIGNDVAIDDIVFKTCGDFISIGDTSGNTSNNICSTETPYTTTLNVTPDNSVFSTHFYQWQTSTNGINWTNISGETNQNITITGINATSYYRARVAESAVNLNNSSCNVVSDVFKVTVNPAPSKPSTVNCWDNYQFNTTSCSWVNIGVQDAQPSKVNCWDNYQFNTTTCSWENKGVQNTQPTNVNCWDNYQFNTTSCTWVNNGNQDPKPQSVECFDNYQFDNITCKWINDVIIPTSPSKVNCWDNFEYNTTSCTWVNNGVQEAQPPKVNCWDNYQFDTTTCLWVNNGNQDIKPILKCWETANFNNNICAWEITSTPPNHLIESVTSDMQNIVIKTSSFVNFEYSIDGINFQTSNIFIDIPSGSYTIFVKQENCPDVITTQHQHIYIPKFFTPNGDLVNDTFELKGLESFSSYEVHIFDRFGKLLKSAKNTSFSWNGTYNSAILPASDYWYRIIIDGKPYTGHFTLLRN